MSTKLCVRNLASSTSEQELEELFRRFGQIDSTALEVTQNAICTVVIGHVVMHEEEDADRAIRQLNFSQHKDRTIGVSKSCAPKRSSLSSRMELGL